MTNVEQAQIQFGNLLDNILNRGWSFNIDCLNPNSDEPVFRVSLYGEAIEKLADQPSAVVDGFCMLTCLQEAIKKMGEPYV